MKPHIIMPAFLGLFTLVSGCTPKPESPEPNLIVSQGNFTIWMPVELERKAVPDEISLSNHPIPCRLYFARDNSVYWMVRYCDIPGSLLDSLTTEDLLEAAEAALLQEAHGRLINSQSRSYLGDPGRRITADSALRGFGFDGTYMAQIQVVKNRIYLVSTYVYNENYDNRMQLMEPFLDSFQLTVDKD